MNMMYMAMVVSKTTVTPEYATTGQTNTNAGTTSGYRVACG